MARGDGGKVVFETDDDRLVFQKRWRGLAAGRRTMGGVKAGCQGKPEGLGLGGSVPFHWPALPAVACHLLEEAERVAEEVRKLAGLGPF